MGSLGAALIDVGLNCQEQPPLRDSALQSIWHAILKPTNRDQYFILFAVAGVHTHQRFLEQIAHN
jgi:hypothetical protein